MQNSQTPVVKDLVLVGGGHSHVAVLKRFGMRPMPGVRLTMICRETHTPYSGMLPGLVAGHYTFDEAHIDLGPLCRFAGARLYHDEAIGLDLDGNSVQCRNRPPVRYDIALDQHRFDAAHRRRSRRHGQRCAGEADQPVHGPLGVMIARVLARNNGVRIGVVGTGAGGVEMLLAVQYRLRQDPAYARPDR